MQRFSYVCVRRETRSDSSSSIFYDYYDKIVMQVLPNQAIMKPGD
jgi:hypothetical protein